MATIRFLGAAQEVTGSCHLIESEAVGQLLLDCGLHQGGKARKKIVEDNFYFNAQSIDTVILSHAHLDHSGRLPKLVHEGFAGTIYCTGSTAELLEIMLLDSFSLYENDLERENIRRARKGKEPISAEYTRDDVIKVLSFCQPCPYNTEIKLTNNASVIFYDAGHILGSAIVALHLTEKGENKKLVFTGDLGKKDTVLMNDPTILSEADIVMMEGTYGDRDHKTLDDTVEQLRDILREGWRKGGNILLPAFAVGRTQELLFYLGQLYQQGELDNWEVFLDSPMAISVTKIYDRWMKTLDCEGVKTLCSGEQTLLKNFLPSLHLTVTPDDSMAINRIKKGAIIIAGSGMCTGGRIVHHFKQRIWEQRNTLVFVGFQAQGTLGRLIVDGAKFIRLFKEELIVKADVQTLNGFSAHAGQTELIDWVASFTNDPRIILVHGEPKALDSLSNKLWNDKGITTEIPAFNQSVVF